MTLDRIPQNIEFKPEFLERYQKLLGERFDEYIKYSSSYIRKSIRVNTLKITVDELRARLKDWKLTPVPWCTEGFWIEHRHKERYDIGNLIEHQLGYFYVQDAASMLPPVVLQPKQDTIVLDLCAAPGSKTTQLAQYMQNTGVLIANDVDTIRLKPLGLNLNRCGITNTVVTLRANKQFAPVFDHILVDAPCSGTGTVRRSLRILQMWSPGLVRRMAGDQKRLLSHAYRLLKPGGTLVYSTCTQEPEENEGVVTTLLDSTDAELLPISLDIQRSPAITEWQGITYHKDIKNVLRIYPQDNDTEGFFVALIKKPTSSPSRSFHEATH